MSLEDGDVILFVVDPYDEVPENIQEQIRNSSGKKILIINKTDLANHEQLDKAKNYWETRDFDSILLVSALTGSGVEQIMKKVIEYLPEHPPYYPKDELTDKNERFFASEIILLSASP